MPYGTESLDELHSLSDLHLGGPAGRQIFDQAPLLAATIDHLASRERAKGRVGLVVNGDALDFLAEDRSSTLAIEEGEATLGRILEDAAFKPVFEALARLVRTPGRLLVLAIGNHDVELALPAVQARLVQTLCGDDPVARGQLQLATDGTGFAARVGTARVLHLHGNEVDDWNVVDHARLRRLRQALQAGVAPPPWPGNAGTRLVVEVMNEVKRAHPIIDLLKPEFEAALPLVLALDPGQVSKLQRLVPVVTRLAVDAARKRVGLLTTGEQAEDQDLEARDTGVSAAWARASTAPPLLGHQLLTRATEELRRGRTPLELIDDRQGSLGYAGLFVDLLRGRSPADNLRDALERYLGRDRSFDPEAPDATFHALDASVGREIDFLVAGHTHLERALPRGSGAYFNTGTWARLVHLEKALLGDPVAFEAAFRAFGSADAAALDPYVLRRGTVASIWAEGSNVHGELRHAELEGAGVRLVRVGPRFTVGGRT